jgi:hypothetical protein
MTSTFDAQRSRRKFSVEDLTSKAQVLVIRNDAGPTHIVNEALPVSVIGDDAGPTHIVNEALPVSVIGDDAGPTHIVNEAPPMRGGRNHKEIDSNQRYCQHQQPPKHGARRRQFLTVLVDDS